MFGRSEDGNRRHAQERGEMHRAGVVRQQSAAFAQLGDQLFHCRLADSIDAILAELIGDKLAAFAISGGAKQDPLHRLLGSDSPLQGELLSYLLFDPDFFTEAATLGRRDAGRWMAENPDLWRTEGLGALGAGPARAGA